MMKASIETILNYVKAATLSAMLAMPGMVIGGTLTPVIDDFNHASSNNLGQPRQFMNDSLAGGGTVTDQTISDGIMQVTGEIVPPRGQPGWASSVLPLGPMGEPQDASDYDGIKLLVKINQGNLTVSANSTEITNFDYHAAPIVVTSDGQFHEVKVPFASMKRGWSEQTELDTKTLNSLSIVAYSLQKAAFDFEVAEVSFY